MPEKFLMHVHVALWNAGGESRYQKVMLYVPLSKLPQGGVRLGGSACVLIKTQNKHKQTPLHLWLI